MMCYSTLEQIFGFSLWTNTNFSYTPLSTTTRMHPQMRIMDLTSIQSFSLIYLITLTSDFTKFKLKSFSNAVFIQLLHQQQRLGPAHL